MGFDLKPVKPSKQYPQDPEDGKPIWGRYNGFAWDRVRCLLYKWGHRYPLPQFNDGELIPKKTCREIAVLISEQEEKGREVPKWLLNDVPLWEHCGGFRVW